MRRILLDPAEEVAFAGGTQPKALKFWERASALLRGDWVETQLLDRRTKLILDGVDEFLTHHPLLTVECFIQLLRYLEPSSYDPRAQCLLVARDSLPGAGELSQHRSDTYELVPLSERTAKKLFPNVGNLLRNVGDSSLRQLLLSPLVLSRLGRRTGYIGHTTPQTRATILRRALETMIEESDMPKLPSNVSFGDPTKAWLQALALVAWILFKDNRGSITVRELSSSIDGIKSVWNTANPSSDAITAGVNILENQRTLSALRSRTVLNTIGRDSIRFAHREWQDILVSDYLAQCAIGQVFPELDYRAFSKQIYIDTADILSRAMIRDNLHIRMEWVNRAIDSGDPFKQPYTLMNVCAIVGNGLVKIDQDAFRQLLNLISDRRCPEVIRLVGVSSFGMRALRTDRDDFMEYVLPNLTTALSEIVKQGKEPRHKISASMAWCYWAELGRKYPALSMDSSEAWPTIDPMTEDGVLAVASSGIVWTEEDGVPRSDGRSKSFQIAAAQYPLAVRNLSKEEISLTHYLFLACVSIRANIATSEIFPLLRAVFSEQSGVAKRIYESALPQVKKLFASCHEAAMGVLQGT
jgi:hypothetical protein